VPVTVSPSRAARLSAFVRALTVKSKSASAAKSSVASPAMDGYTSSCSGRGPRKAKNVRSRSAASSRRRMSSPRRWSASSACADDMLLEVGAHISADHFVPGQHGRRLGRVDRVRASPAP
jgi:hypothetical protein